MLPSCTHHPIKAVFGFSVQALLPFDCMRSAHRQATVSQRQLAELWKSKDTREPLRFAVYYTGDRNVTSFNFITAGSTVKDLNLRLLLV